MASLQAFLSFLPRAAIFPLPLLTPANQATTVMCLLPVQDICSELLLVLHIKYTPHLQKKKIQTMGFSPTVDLCKFTSSLKYVMLDL